MFRYSSSGTCLVVVCVLMYVDCGSIMDMINTSVVERLIAEKQNRSRDKIMKENLMEDYSDDEELLADKLPYEDFEIPRYTDSELDIMYRKLFHRINRTPKKSSRQNNTTEIPEVSTVIADITQKRKSKQGNKPIIVTKLQHMKKDWCKTEPVIQKIREDGCWTRTLLNKFCYGQCNSFFIPKNNTKRKKIGNRKTNDEIFDKMAPAFKSCAFCKPKKFSWVTIVLKCPGKLPEYKVKKVQLIKECRCISQRFK